MNTKLNIRGFKCFRDVEIPLKRLTVFAGANGQGKSTGIQSLLLLRQTIELLSNYYNDSKSLTPFIHGSYKQRIGLNDRFCLALGTSTSVLNNSSDNPITLGLTTNNELLKISFNADNIEDQLYLEVLNYERNLNQDNSIFKKEFYYLNAERLGPRVNQQIANTPFSHTGWRGEYTAQVLSEKEGLTEVDKTRWFKDTTNKFLDSQVNNWLNFIIPGTRINAVHSKKTLSAQLLLENEYSGSIPSLATNLGFGISYVIPIIVSGLIAKKGAFLVVENPEAHLHPSAQSKIGRFLARISGAGVNVIIETHSDHIINGIQIGFVEEKKLNKNVLVNFFGSNSANNEPEIESIELKEDGMLERWPKGFFDQTQIDFADLLKKRNG